MVVPIPVRDVVAVAGAVLVLSAVASVVGTVIVPRRSPDSHGFFETAVLDTAAMAGLITRPMPGIPI
ncbi:MAG TPA: hypothetical protein VN969_39085 [Streptosporangiaceae bacterium]|nr:hypothetical protein [Streptosporangiaceae bacterium]